jgi:prevent-host-death family protein
MPANRVVNVSEFKAKCVAMISEVESSQSPITVTRRGKPVVALVPLPVSGFKSLAGSWAKRGRIVGDIVNKDTSDRWDVVRKH